MTNTLWLTCSLIATSVLIILLYGQSRYNLWSNRKQRHPAYHLTVALWLGSLTLWGQWLSWEIAVPYFLMVSGLVALSISLAAPLFKSS